MVEVRWRWRGLQQSGRMSKTKSVSRLLAREAGGAVGRETQARSRTPCKPRALSLGTRGPSVAGSRRPWLTNIALEISGHAH